MLEAQIYSTGRGDLLIIQKVCEANLVRRKENYGVTQTPASRPTQTNTHKVPYTHRQNDG